MPQRNKLKEEDFPEEDVPEEEGLGSAGFLPFDLDEYINLSSIGKKGLSKILQAIGKRTATKASTSKIDDAIKQARASKALREAALKAKREKAKASGMKDPNKWLGTMDRGDPNIKQPGNDPVFLSREIQNRPYGSGMPKKK